MMIETDCRVIINGRWRGEEYYQGTRAKGGLGQLDKRGADPEVLIFGVDCQVGQVTAVMKIGHRSRDTQQSPGLPATRNKIGVLQHTLQAGFILNRPPSAKSRTPQYVAELLHGERFRGRVMQVLDWSLSHLSQ